MKRNKRVITKVFPVLITILFALVSGCKTLPQESANPVQPVDLLDDEGAMYIHIPAGENRELLELFVLNYYKGISESEAKLLVSKLNDVYAAYGSRKDKKRVHIAAGGELPSNAASMIKKSGAQESLYTPATLFGSELPAPSAIPYYTKDGVSIAFPSSKIAALGKNIQSMLDNYNTENEVLNGRGGMELDFASVFRNDWKSTDLYQWIAEDVPSIHFYIVRPQAFLTNLIGTDVSSKVFKLQWAKGNFSKLPNSKYELTLDLEFLDAKYVKPAVSILTLTLGLTDSEVVMSTPTHVTLKGVHLNTKQLINMLGV